MSVSVFCCYNRMSETRRFIKNREIRVDTALEAGKIKSMEPESLGLLVQAFILRPNTTADNTV